MNYTEFTKKYWIDLFDMCGRDGHDFTPYHLANGWAWWSEQPFSSEGICRCRETEKEYRLISTVKQSGKLKCRMYKRGPRITAKQKAEWAGHKESWIGAAPQIRRRKKSNHRERGQK